MGKNPHPLIDRDFGSLVKETPRVEEDISLRDQTIAALYIFFFSNPFYILFTAGGPPGGDTPFLNAS